MIALIFQTSDAAKRNKTKKTNGVVDQDFLNKINSLKSQMIENGSKFKNLAMKFISKTNRFVIANETIKVLLTLILILFNLINYENPNEINYKSNSKKNKVIVHFIVLSC